VRILLVNPPLLPTRESAPPLGLCTLASWLIAAGHELAVLDLDLELKSAAHDPRHEFLALFSRAVQRFEPELIGFTSMYNNSLQAEQLIRLAKRVRPSAWTVAGGPHFGAVGSDALARIAELDFVVAGEGEVAAAALAAALQRNEPLATVLNLCYRDGGAGVVTNAHAPLLDLAALPDMWSTLGGAVDLRRYTETLPADGSRRPACVEAGRGCPFSCSFCAPAVFWQRRYRVKPADRLVGEMRYLNERYGYDSFLLVHDLLTASSAYVGELCDALLAADLPVEWMGNSRTDIDLRNLLPAMRRAGCWKLFFGVESASDRIQESVNKHLTRAQTVATIEGLARNSIDATCSFVIGFPDETRAELSQSIRLGARLKLIGAETVQFHRLRLFPPAPLTTTGLKSQFDFESLKMEYPFANLVEEDVDEIRSSPQFFAGYFAPQTQAAAAADIAQTELFFQQAVAIAPITVSIVGALLGDELLDAFIAAIDDLGRLDRYAFDWTSIDLERHWEAIGPYLLRLAEPARETTAWAAAMIDGALRYERNRLQVVVGRRWDVDGGSSPTDGLSIFPLEIDIDATIARIRQDEPLDGELVRPTRVILARSGAGVTAYQEPLAAVGAG
jgi:radical SAM superfamily enzyme YgiQ (UPF0313 family)